MLEVSPPRLHLIAHRGAQDQYPENTLASCEAAIALGFDWIEVDLQLTACGHWVVIHDLLLDRTTNGQGPVRTKTLSELAALRIQQIHPILTLEKLLQCMGDHSVTLNLELKILPEQQADALKAIDPLLRHWPLSRPPYFSSFNHLLLDSIRSTWPQYPLGYLTDRPTTPLLHKLLSMPNVSLNYHAERISLEEVQLLSKEISLLTYTVNDLSHAKSLINAGIFGIFTDETKMLSESLASRALS